MRETFCLWGWEGHGRLKVPGRLWQLSSLGWWEKSLLCSVTCSLEDCLLFVCLCEWRKWWPSSSSSLHSLRRQSSRGNIKCPTTCTQHTQTGPGETLSCGPVERLRPPHSPEHETFSQSDCVISPTDHNAALHQVVTQ